LAHELDKLTPAAGFSLPKLPRLQVLCLRVSVKRDSIGWAFSLFADNACLPALHVLKLELRAAADGIPGVSDRRLQVPQDAQPLPEHLAKQLERVHVIRAGIRRLNLVSEEWDRLVGLFGDAGRPGVFISDI
jgi:hypothetical protein